MNLTRRRLLALLATAPFAAGGCCTHKYPIQSPITPVPPDFPRVTPLLTPPANTVAGRLGVIDVHAHFFNASDVPVRDFLVECIGHTKPKALQWLLRLAAPFADGLARLAPTADDELTFLKTLLTDTVNLSLDNAHEYALTAMASQRDYAAGELAKLIRGTEFETEARRLRSGRDNRAMGAHISKQEILDIADQSTVRSYVRPTDKEGRDDLAAFRGGIRFLVFMVSYRAANIEEYKKAFQRPGQALGVDKVVGSLVDFDYWLDCPPRSSHESQAALYKRLADMHKGFFFPAVAYNPWTDIEQSNAGLDRVKQAKDDGFVAVKIYPPVGFRPSHNVADKRRKKPHPNFQRLDAALEEFFAWCESSKFPVIAHAEHTNGRDDKHDEFSSPTAWEKFLSSGKKPVISLGHFGGGGADPNTYWTKDFAQLMTRVDAPLYGDLGYWVDLMDSSNVKYEKAKARLKYALELSIEHTQQTVADRVMFGTDWLMISTVDRWPEYLDELYEAISDIAPPEVVKKVFADNAKQCFNL